MTAHLHIQHQTLQTNSSFTHPLKQFLCTTTLLGSALLLGQATQVGGYQNTPIPYNWSALRRGATALYLCRL